MATEQIPAPPRRRDLQREETRRDLARIALELASARGLGNVRVPEIAAAAGVSTRTFNNYFPSKEAAITWPAMRRATQMADSLLARPEQEPLGAALIAAISGLHRRTNEGQSPSEWLGKLRSLVATEPSLRGEYLKASDAAEQALARAIASRTGAAANELQPKVVAAIAVGAERAAVRYWIQRNDKRLGLSATVRAALEQALSGLDR